MDCDSFFVQVARLEDPEGAGRHPLLLVGGRSNRGVITSASYAVRDYGVRSGMPTSRALQLCPEALVVPVPRGAVVERSRAVRAVLGTLSPVVQAASIDEFYLDLTGTERMLKGEDLADTADRIRREVKKRTEVTVSLGGGTQRIVAKVATRVAKPNGVHVVPPGDEADFMLRFRLSDLPGIGPAFLKQLSAKGLRTSRRGRLRRARMAGSLVRARARGLALGAGPGHRRKRGGCPRQTQVHQLGAHLLHGHQR